MAEPLFIDKDKLLERQRLSSLDEDGDAAAQVDLAIESVATEFYRRLGLTDLNALVALKQLDGVPSTDDEYKQLIAQVTEQKLVRVRLLREFNTITRQGGASRVFQEWNESPAFRGTTEKQRSEELERCNLEIEQAFMILSGEVSAGGAAHVRADSIKSKLADRFRVVGFSLYSSDPYLFCFALDKSND